MGGICSICAETNPNFSVSGISPDDNAERCLSYAENKCAISKKNAPSIILAFQGESSKNKLSFTQLKRVSGKLGLDKIDMQNPDSPISLFLASLEHNGETDELTMLTAAILISSSTAKDKAGVIFDAYDKESTKLLREADVRNFLSDCFDASTVHLTNLANDKSSLNAEALKLYLAKITPFKQQFVESTQKIIMKSQPEIGKSRFIESYQNEIPALITATGIRTEVFKKYPTKFN